MSHCLEYSSYLMLFRHAFDFQADRLLELGFQEEVAELVKACPIGRQTLLFSATMNTKVDDLASLALNKVLIPWNIDVAQCHSLISEAGDIDILFLVN